MNEVITVEEVARKMMIERRVIRIDGRNQARRVRRDIIDGFTIFKMLINSFITIAINP